MYKKKEWIITTVELLPTAFQVTEWIFPSTPWILLEIFSHNFALTSQIKQKKIVNFDVFMVTDLMDYNPLN